MAIGVTTKCNSILSNINTVISNYSATFGPSGDSTCISTTISITAGAVAIRNTAESQSSSAVQDTALLVSGGTAGSLNTILDTNAAFTAWLNSITEISNGTYIDPVNTLITNIGTGKTTGQLQTALGTVNSTLSTKSSNLNSLISNMNAYQTAVQTYIKQSAMLNLASSHQPMLTLMPTLQVYNTNGYAGVNAVSQAVSALGSGASQGAIKTLATSNLVSAGGFHTSISVATSGMNNYITQLG